MKNARVLVDTYGDMIYRICLVALKNHADAEDALQEVFLKYITHAPDFHSDEHEKAWLITVAVNQCRNMLRCRRLIPTDPELLSPPGDVTVQNDAYYALMQLPEKFRIVLVLRYVHGYRVDEIARMIGKSPRTVKMRLSNGKKMLSDICGKENLS